MSNDVKKKIKVAVIGTGGPASVEDLYKGFSSPENWGMQHIRVFSQHPRVDLCALVGRSLERTVNKAESVGARAYTSVAAMMEQEKPDLVSICLPNQQHFDTTLEVIQYGVPLLVEKPLVFSLKEARILIDEAAKRNTFFAINFNHRYALPVDKAYRAIQENRLGDIVFCSWRFGGEGWSDHPHANLIETQCHGFDMLEYLCGPVSSVMAEMTDITGKGFSTMSVSFRFANGSVGSMLGSYDTSYAYKDSHRVEVNGTKGRVLIEDTVMRYEFQEAGSELAEVWRPGYFNDAQRDFHKTFDWYINDLLDALEAGKEPPVSAAKGYRALELAHAVIRSYETGCRVTL